jgi:hypothetical protein
MVIQRGCYRGKDKLEIDKRSLGEAEFRHEVVQHRDLGLGLLGGVAQDRGRLSGERAEHHHHGVDGPFSLNQSCVQNGQVRNAHQPDQSVAAVICQALSPAFSQLG